MKAEQIERKAGHTPGPWRIWRDMDPKEPVQIIGMETDFICQIDHLNTNHAANAKLIAAAPALLKACQMLGRWIEQDNNDDPELERMTLQTVYEHVEAAITKATT